MNRFASLLIVALATLLAGCEIVVTGGVGGSSDVDIWNASYATDAKAVVDGVETFVICDDRVTDLRYSFEYEGALQTWTSYLHGVHSGDTIGRQTFSAGDPRVSYEPHRVSVTYGIHSGMAPLANDADGTVETAGIVVVPVPHVIGYTLLYLELDGPASARRLVSKDIPVLSSCTS